MQNLEGQLLSAHGHSKKSLLPQRKFLPSKNSELPNQTHHTLFAMSAVDFSNKETDDELKSWQEWVGHRVSISGVKFGILRYFGTTQFAEGLWCGVELDEPVGKNNGIVKDVRYFTCKENFGIFAPLSKTEKILDSDSNGGIPAANKSKLPHPKSKMKFTSQQKGFPQLSCDMTFHDVTKSHSPFYTNNANELKTNAVNEVYSSQRRLSNGYESKKCELSNRSFKSNNNENNTFTNMGHQKIVERRTSTPISLLKKHTEEQTLDFLNRTVTLNGNRKVSSPKQDTSFGLLPTNCLLNATFNIFGTPVLQNENVDKKENTFVLENADNVFSTDFTKASLESQISSEEDLMSTELEESLGILSPSQMKDFTVSVDNSTETAVLQKSSEIRKIESCDDVNEIPEFEISRISQGFLSGESYSVIADLSSEKSLSDKVVQFGTQTFALVDNKNLHQKNTHDTEIRKDCAETEAECVLNKPCVDRLSKELEKIKCDFSFSDCHRTEDINFNVVPSATSTPTLPISNLPKLTTTKLPFRRCYLDSSHKHSDSKEPVVPSKFLNQTFDHPVTEDPASKVNVISKLLNDLDSVPQKPFQTVYPSVRKGMSIGKCDEVTNYPISTFNDTHIFDYPASEETETIVECVSNNLNQEANCHIIEHDIELNISSLEKQSGTSNKTMLCGQQQSISCTKLDINLQDEIRAIKSGMANCFEENKILSVQSERASDGQLLHLNSLKTTSNPDLDANKTAAADLSSKNSLNSIKEKDMGQTKILSGKNFRESNFVKVYNTCRTVEVMPEKCDSVIYLSAENLKKDMQIFNEPSELLRTSNCSEKSMGSGILSIISDSLNSINNDGENVKVQTTENFNVSSLKIEVTEVDELEIDVLNKTGNLNSNFSAKEGIQFDHHNIKNNKFSEAFSCSALEDLKIANQTISLNEKYDQNFTSNDVAASEVFGLQTLANTQFIDLEVQNNECKNEANLNATHVLNVAECQGNNSQSDQLNLTIDKADGCQNFKLDVSDTNSDKNAKLIPGSKNAKSSKIVSGKKSDIKSMPAKQPKKNVVSKIKLMLENSKNNSAANQENVNSKSHTVNQKKTGKWDTVTSKIAASLADNKKKVKKEVTSRVNTNLIASRVSTPKTSPRPSIIKCAKFIENRKNVLSNETMVSNNLKNTLTVQKACEDSKSLCLTEECSGEKDLRVLTQLQNVDKCSKQSNNFKVPIAPPKKKKLGLFSKASDFISPSDSASSCGSQTSLSSSKIATLQRKNSTSSQNNVLNKVQKTHSSVSVGAKEKEPPSKSEIDKIPPRRHNTLPKVKQCSRSVFQRK